MKKLFYSVCSLHHPHTGILLDKLLADKNKGIEVILAYCSQALPSCISNKNGNKGICWLCQHMYRNIVNEYLKDIQVIPINSKDFKPCSMKFEYDDIKDLRNISYRDVHIGLSLLSFYITFTRKTEGIVSKEHRQYFDAILSALCSFIDYAYDFIEGVNPDVITIFNGRMFESRLFFEIAKAKNIKFESLEVDGGFGEPFYRVEFEGDLPHSIKLRTKLINELWEKTKLSGDEREKLAESFYYNRRHNVPAADRVYTGAQKKGLLPDNYNPDVPNVIIFNSSEDEFAALGGEWEEDKLFETQKETVEFVLEHVHPNVHVYLRIHPHLKGVEAKYHTELYELSSKPNLTIIPPESPISSYALLDVADKVIVMGSTMGVESCFWGKPVINLRKSWYDHLDVSYIPKSINEFDRLLKENIPSKDKIGALKYGFYFMERDESVEKDNYINFNTYTSKFMGKPIGDVVDYLKMFGSSTIFKIFSIKFYKHAVKYFKNTVPFPGC